MNHFRLYATGVSIDISLRTTIIVCVRRPTDLEHGSIRSRQAMPIGWPLGRSSVRWALGFDVVNRVTIGGVAEHNIWVAVTPPGTATGAIGYSGVDIQSGIPGSPAFGFRGRSVLRESDRTLRIYRGQPSGA